MFVRFMKFTAFIFGLIYLAGLDACCYNASQQITTAGSTLDSSLLFINDGCFIVGNNRYPTAGNISTFSYDTSSCLFSTTPNTFASGIISLYGQSLAYVPSCSLLIALDFSSSTMRLFNVADCQLTEISPAIPVAGQPRWIAVSPDGKLIAVTTGSQLHLYTVDAECTVSLCASTSFVGFSANSVAFAPNCNFLVVTTGLGSIVQIPYTTNPCALLSQNQIAIPGGLTTTALAFSPNGSCLAVLDGDPEGFIKNSVDMFSITGCDINFIQSFNTNGTVPQSLAFSGDGGCLAISNAGVTANTSIFQVTSGCSLGAVSQTLAPFGIVAFSSGTCNVLAIADFLDTTINIYTSCPAPVLTISQCCKRMITSHGCSTFVITVTNSGNASANGIIVTDIVPSCLKIEKIYGDDWQIEAVDNVVTARLTTLAPGASASFTIKASALRHVKQVLTNCASVISDEITTPVESKCTTLVFRK